MGLYLGVSHQFFHIGRHVELVLIDHERQFVDIGVGIFYNTRRIIDFGVNMDVGYRFRQIGILKGSVVGVDVDIKFWDVGLIHNAIEFAFDHKISRGLYVFDVLGILLGNDRQKVLEIGGWRFKTDVHLLGLILI